MCHSAVVCASSRCLDLDEQFGDAMEVGHQAAQRLSNGSMVIALRLVKREADAGLRSRRDLRQVVDEIDRIMAELREELRDEGDY